MIKFLKALSRNETLLIACISVPFSIYWANTTGWKDVEPLLTLTIACITVTISVLLRIYKVHDNTGKVISEHYCKKPAFEPTGTDRCRILIGNFINDKTEQVALELTAKYKQVKFTELPALHIRYCQNYEVHASNALKIKDENYCDLLFFGDMKEAGEGKNFIRLNFVVQKRISLYSIDKKNVSEDYHEFTPNAITQGIITAKYDFFIFFIAGIAAFYKNEYPQAKAHFLKALKYSESHEALSFLADCAYYEGDLATTMKYVDQALSIHPDYPPALITKAEIIHRENPSNPDASIKMIEKALSVDPNTWAGHNNLGIKYQHKGDYEKALACFTKSISVTPNTMAYHNRGVLYKMRPGIRPDSGTLAINDFINCLELTGNRYLYAHQELARMYNTSAQYAKVLPHAEYYLKHAEYGSAEVLSAKACALIHLKRDFKEADDAAYMAFDIAKAKKDSEPALFDVCFMTLVLTLTMYSEYLLRQEQEEQAFNKITAAFDLVKNLELEKRAIFRETILTYSVFMYNRGQKQYAIHLLSEIEELMTKDDIYRKYVLFKKMYLDNLHVPGIYIDITG